MDPSGGESISFEGNHAKNSYMIKWLIQCNSLQGNITAVRYQEEILADLIPQLHYDEMEVGYFQQDGATAHSATW